MPSAPRSASGQNTTGIDAPILIVEAFKNKEIGGTMVGDLKMRETEGASCSLINRLIPPQMQLSLLMTVLVQLYDKVSPGGYIVFDDFHYWEGCRRACDDFFKSRRIPIEYNEVDGCAAFIRKSSKNPKT
ncbi:MAG: TylF/MycF/NovP-related O-methyltransferase [Planctomycetota bacterium]